MITRCTCTLCHDCGAQTVCHSCHRCARCSEHVSGCPGCPDRDVNCHECARLEAIVIEQQDRLGKLERRIVELGKTNTKLNKLVQKAKLT